MYFADITLPIVGKVGQDLTVNKSDIVPTGISTGDFLLISETTSSINPTKYNVLYKIKSTTTTLVKLEGTNGITTFTPETKAPTELGSFPGGDYWNISGKYLKITYAPGFVKGKRYAVSTIYGDSGHQYYFEFTYEAFAGSNHKYQVIPFITDMGNVASCDVSPTDLKLSTRNDSLTHEDWGIPTLYELH